MPRHTLSSKDNDRHLRVAAGDEVVIELPEKSTAGYEWATRDVPQGVDVRIERPATDPGRAVGADALTRVHVTVHQSPGGRLVLVHRQPWDAAGTATSFAIELEPD